LEGIAVRPYKVLITLEVLRLPRPAVRERQMVIVFLESLSADPLSE
jgi:hypothetical protein